MKRFVFIFTVILTLGGIIMLGFNGCSDTNDDFKKHPTLSFDSFDGGGYNYNAVIEDKSIVSCTESHKYSNPNHAEMEGSAFDVIFEFTGLKEGRTRLKIEARSPIIEPEDYYYEITVDADLNVNIKQT